jgi:ribonuclease HI
MTIQSLLEEIAGLPEDERQDLLSRLREIYGVLAPSRQTPAPPQVRVGLGLSENGWTGAADYLIVFDGGSRGNPGVGYGSYAVFDGTKPGQVQRLEYPDPMTNNEAEYHTLIDALAALARRLGQRAAGTSLEVRGDSQLVIQQVLGNWKAKDERMRGLRDQARAWLRRFGKWRLVSQPREDSVRVLGH